ncbi:MAG: hypothetical protein KBT09_01910 [Bacteroidales bacterium]|nr:hypothetical protein [Candidatus Sodaliphilus fimicaballi]
MERFQSDVQCIAHNINTIFDKLSNPSRYKQLLEDNADKLPEEARKNLDKVQFDDDGIAIQSPMGAIKLAVDQATTIEPTRIAYTAVGSPVKFGLAIDLKAIDENTTEEVATIELDLPFFMAKMVAPQLKDGAKKFGELLKMIPYDNL